MLGIERFNKSMNAGNLFRSAHAFGASFIFTVDSKFLLTEIASDTLDLWKQVPFSLPFTRENYVSQALRSCRSRILRRGSLTDELLEHRDHIVKIPTQFCVNVSTADAVVMYHRSKTLGRFAHRPVIASGAQVPLNRTGHGKPIFRKQVF